MDLLQVGAALGLDALLRFPVWPYYNAAQAVDAASSSWAYFYGSARFLYPEARLFLRWQVARGLALVFSVRALYPLAHLWEGQTMPLWDELMVNATVGFSIPLGGAAEPEAPPAEPVAAEQPAPEA